MPDIAMCEGKGCLHKDKCYRYRAIPSEYRQAYLTETPCNNGACDYFYPIVKGMKLAKIKEK